MTTKKRKILCIHQGFELYGSDRSFISTLESLKLNDTLLHITAIIPRHGAIVQELEKYTDELIIENIGSITTSAAKHKPIISLIKVVKASFKAKQRINKADLIYINTIVPLGYILAGFFSSKPIFIHAREIPSHLISNIFSFWFRISRFNLIFNSYSTQKSFFIANPNKSRVIWNGVPPVQEDKSLKETTETLNILIIGRINRWKGQMFFLNTFNALPSSYKNQVSIYIVGDTPKQQQYFKDALQKFVNDNTLRNNVQFFPFDENPEKYYTWADIVVVPSTLPEPFGRVAIEAMSASKPVLAANHGGLSEIVIDKKTGWLFTPNDSVSLKNSLEKIIGNQTNHNTLGENAKKRYEQEFTIDKYQDSIFTLLSKDID